MILHFLEECLLNRRLCNIIYHSIGYSKPWRLLSMIIKILIQLGRRWYLFDISLELKFWLGSVFDLIIVDYEFRLISMCLSRWYWTVFRMRILVVLSLVLVSWQVACSSSKGIISYLDFADIWVMGRTLTPRMHFYFI